MERQQLEMNFDPAIPLRPANRGQRRLRCAPWWFAQMRQVVDRAWDRETATVARHEQGSQPLSHAPGQN